MSKKISVLLAAMGIIALAAVIVVNNSGKTSVNKNITGSAQNSNIVKTAPLAPENKEPAVKEFITTSFVEMVDGLPKPQYLLKEITVNRGDKVRIKITVTAGGHDFKIDEYGIYADTQLNQEYVVEFTADKAGEFIYYCTKPGHRQNGHWGTLKVLDI